MLYIVALFVLTWLLLLAAGFLYQWIGGRIDVRKYPAPGRFVASGAHKLHVYDLGEGSPAVVLESGISATSVNWRRVQSEVAKFTRVVAYDRAGLGWSDPARTPRTASQVVDELHEMLCNSGIPGPYVLVGHSFGGLASRLYAARYPAEVAGLVLVDPLRPEEWWPMTAEQKRILAGGAMLSRWGAILAHAGIVRFTLMRLAGGARFLPRLIGRAASTGAGLSTMERIAGEIRKMPEELWPAIISHWCQPKSFRGMGRHLSDLRETVSAMAGAAPLSIPVILITGGKNTPVPEGEPARISTSARHVVAEKSGHWIHLDEPELVIEAVREMVMAVREGVPSLP